MELIESTGVTGICPACGQPAKLVKERSKEGYFWDHDNLRDLHIHKLGSAGEGDKVLVEEAEAHRLINLSESGKKVLVGHSDSVVCVRTGEIYPHKWKAIRETDMQFSALINALNDGCQADGSYWRYENYFWLSEEEVGDKEASLNSSLQSSFATEAFAVDEPESFLKEKACPECGSHQVYIEGRTMLPALMEAHDIIITTRLTRRTGVDKTTLRKLKKWSSDRSLEEMDAARAIAEEFSVSAEYLLSLDAGNSSLEYFWESLPSRVVCCDCDCKLPWEEWIQKASSREFLV